MPRRPEEARQAPPEVSQAEAAEAQSRAESAARAEAQARRRRRKREAQARAEAVDGRRHLHAWPEALLPGAGWRGWDPTHGVRVTDGHVVLCAAPTQAETMTVSGGFWGPSGVRSTLSFTLEIEAEE